MLQPSPVCHRRLETLERPSPSAARISARRRDEQHSVQRHDGESDQLGRFQHSRVRAGGATTGSVVVTVGGVASNGVTFTVNTASGLPAPWSSQDVGIPPSPGRLPTPRGPSRSPAPAPTSGALADQFRFVYQPSTVTARSWRASAASKTPTVDQSGRHDSARTWPPTHQTRPHSWPPAGERLSRAPREAARAPHHGICRSGTPMGAARPQRQHLPRLLLRQWHRHGP